MGKIPLLFFLFSDIMVLVRNDAMKIIKDFKDYEIIDSSRGEKLERWGDFYLLRPDPQIIWDTGDLSLKYKGMIHAKYHRSNKGGGYWEELKEMPERFEITYHDLTFNIKKMGFNHTGLFPEQAVNWDIMQEKIKNSGRDIRVLNLFAYTGGASVACLKAGASVVHVDSSRGMVDWAKENVASSNLADKPIRFLVDDVIKFVEREIRRGHTYDAIIMDPPSFGRGANGEVWSIENDLDQLVTLCSALLSEHPLFFLINSYTAGLSKEVMVSLLKLRVLYKFSGVIEADEIGIPIQVNDLILPCGVSVRIDFDE